MSRAPTFMRSPVPNNQMMMTIREGANDDDHKGRSNPKVSIGSL